MTANAATGDAHPGVAPPVTTLDRLSSTLFLAALLHGVLILGVTFSTFDGLRGDEIPTLRVTVVAPQDDADPPPDADLLAQTAVRGSGTDDASVDPAAPRRQPAAGALDPPDTGADLRSALPGSQQPEPDQLLSPAPSDRVAMALPDPTPQQAERPERARAEAAAPSAESRILVEDERLQASGERRELVISPDTRQSDVAPYLADWRGRVERVGTYNFPEQARLAGRHGNPVLEVAIRADGTLQDIVVLRSSGQSLLDQAALGILRLAAPFDPFPDALRERYDVLRFAYEWQFDDRPD